MRIKLTGDNSNPALTRALTAIQTDPQVMIVDGRIVYINDLEGIPVGYVEISIFNGALRLCAINVRPDRRGNKWGTYLLHKVLMHADAHAVAVELSVDPYGGGACLGKSALRDWYRRNGFVPKHRWDMVRKVPSWAHIKGLSFEEARRLANAYGGIVRPFEKDASNNTISYGVTDHTNVIVPIHGSIMWWQYRKKFTHDLLLEREKELDCHG